MKKIIGAGAALAILVAGATLLLVGVGVGAGASASSTAAKRGTALAGKAYFQHGKLVAPPEIAVPTSRLNTALETCYLANGATRAPLKDGGGFSYADPNGTAAAACRSEQTAVNMYAESPELRAFGAAVQPLAAAFWGCLSNTGVLPRSDHETVDQASPRFIAAVDSCSAEANASVGVSPGS